LVIRRSRFRPAEKHSQKPDFALPIEFVETSLPAEVPKHCGVRIAPAQRQWGRHFYECRRKGMTISGASVIADGELHSWTHGRGALSGNHHDMVRRSHSANTGAFDKTLTFQAQSYALTLSPGLK
jgi:hypothetical protein